MRSDHRVDRWPKRLAALCLAACQLLLLLLLSPNQTSLAQDEAVRPTYWRYDASGRIDQLHAADLDGDGQLEFLLGTQSSELVAVESDGAISWQRTFEQPILATAVLKAGAANSGKNVAVVTPSHIIVLRPDGEIAFDNEVEFDSPPVAATSYDFNNNGSDQLLVTLTHGAVALFDRSGARLWSYEGEQRPNFSHNANATVLVLSAEEQAHPLVVFGYRSVGGFSRIRLLAYEEEVIASRWQKTIDGDILSLTAIQFSAESAPHVAVGNSIGEVRLFDAGGQPVWRRTLNKPITALTSSVNREGAPILYAGTSVGRLVGFSEVGQRTLDITFAEDANRAITAIAAAPTANINSELIKLVVTLAESVESQDESAESADILLLNELGRPVNSYPSRSPAGLIQLIDSNQDEQNELLFLQFGALELIAPSTTRSKSLEAWQTPYRLNAAPTNALTTDLDRDGSEELFIGARDGRLHRVQPTGASDWIEKIGRDIVTLVSLPPNGVEEGAIVAAISEEQISEEGQPAIIFGRIKAYAGDSRLLWESDPISGNVTHLVSLSDPEADARVVLATDTRQFQALDSSGNIEWSRFLASDVTYVTELSRNGQPVVAFSTDEKIFVYAADGTFLGEYAPRQLALLEEQESDVPVDSNCESPAQLLYILEHNSWANQFCYGRRLSEWQSLIGRSTTERLQVSNALFTVLDEDEILRLSIEEEQPSQGQVDRQAFADVRSFHFADFDGDNSPDLAVGEGTGGVQIFTSSDEQPVTIAPLQSRISHINGLKADPVSAENLVVITENGLVRLFSSQLNYKPLLTDVQATGDETQVTVSATIFNVEAEPISVRLETLDNETGQWEAGESRMVNQQGDLFWVISTPEREEALRYRLIYNDDSFQGVIVGEVEPPMRSQLLTPAVVALVTPIALSAMVVLAGVTLIRQRRSPAGRARRFYRSLRSEPELTLPTIEAIYSEQAGDSEFLLNFASAARRDGNRLLADIGDGLFLLGERPDASVPILRQAMESSAENEPAWIEHDVWQTRFEVMNDIIESTSLTEVSQLRPTIEQLDQTLAKRAKQRTFPAETALPPLAPTGPLNYTSLLPIIDSLNDSERVKSPEDRLFYLNEAAAQLRQLKQNLVGLPATIDLTLIRGVVQRLAGVTSASIESLRGRARVEAKLITRRIAPEASATLALELANVGRADAENVHVALNSGEGYIVHTPEEVLPFLSAGRTHTLNFAITPPDTDQFRVRFDVSYDDRQRVGKSFAYANQVNVLSPATDFRTIPNPYAPGSPLRKNSTLFFGRKDLFDFIAEEANRLSQQKVLILVGQRRTGKTSALLRLEKFLPPHLIPIYIDCQSLGVLPGMTAFLQDIAWIIAETLEMRGHEIQVPDLGTLHGNPAHWFRRTFLPLVRDKVGEETMLLLVFDEFEAFENLVNDGILPPTLFPMLRNLMQHGDGLSFIFTGTRRLEEMTTSYWNVLFNIALYKRVDFLERDAAIQLITEPVAPNLVYDDLAIDKLLRITAGHPYFLQLVCYTVVKRANNTQTGYATISDINEAVEEMLRLGEVHFAFLWERSSATERILLTAIAHLIDREQPFRPIELVQALEPFGIRLDPRQVTRALDRLVERDIMREIQAEGTLMYELRIGLVGLWVEQNKSLARLYDAGRTYPSVPASSP